MVTVQCDECFATYRINPSKAGKRVKCKSCGSVFTAVAPEAVDRHEEATPGRDDYADRGAVKNSQSRRDKPRKRRRTKKRKAKREVRWGMLFLGMFVLGLSVAIDVAINVYYAGIFHRGRGVPAWVIIMLLTLLHIGIAWPISRTGKSSFSMSVFAIFVSLYFMPALVGAVGMLSPETRLVFLNNPALSFGSQIVCFFVGLIPAGLPIVGWKMLYAGLGLERP